MLIYLNRTAQERVMETLHFALNRSGFLFLGSSESTDGSSDLFALHSREHHIYQKRDVAAHQHPVPESVPTFRHQPLVLPDAAQTNGEPPRDRMTSGELHPPLLA